MNCQAVLANRRPRKIVGELGFFQFSEKGSTAAAPRLNPAYLLAIPMKILPISDEHTTISNFNQNWKKINVPPLVQPCQGYSQQGTNHSNKVTYENYCHLEFAVESLCFVHTSAPLRVY
tara:strand:+ start:1012 stop:1368 length:357 start_codon:yes stop_codon:yes gene_type:complete